MRRSSTSYVHGAPALHLADLPEAFLRGWAPRTDNGTSDNTPITENSLRPACDAIEDGRTVRLWSGTRACIGTCNYGDLIDTLFTDVEGVA